MTEHHCSTCLHVAVDTGGGLVCPYCETTNVRVLNKDERVAHIENYMRTRITLQGFSMSNSGAVWTIGSEHGRLLSVQLPPLPKHPEMN